MYRILLPDAWGSGLSTSRPEFRWARKQLLSRITLFYNISSPCRRTRYKEIDTATLVRVVRVLSPVWTHLMLKSLSRFAEDLNFLSGTRAATG